MCIPFYALYYVATISLPRMIADECSICSSMDETNKNGATNKTLRDDASILLNISISLQAFTSNVYPKLLLKTKSRKSM